MTILATEGSGNPWATAFFYMAVIVAVLYFGWNLYKGGQKERAEREAADTEPEVIEGTGETRDDDADRDDPDTDRRET